MRDIGLIVVHCADTPASMDIGAAEIKRWHTEERGWSDIGYHYVIRRDGTVETGRSEDIPGAHVYGHNRNSIGICLVGGKGGCNFTFEQFFALRGLLERLAEKYPSAKLCGHRDLDAGKTCPSFDVRVMFSVPPAL